MEDHFKFKHEFELSIHSAKTRTLLVCLRMERGMISVDRWSEASQAYFLTHLHADHTKGLSATWHRGPLFCSCVTAKLFPFKFPGFEVSLLRVLEIGSWQSLSLVSPSSRSETKFEVIAIDAYHCPGAIMYLFCGEFGNMLYTGDFRWESKSERAQAGRTMLLDALKNEKVDILYLDNTYCNPSYSFPSREAAAQQVVNIIKFHPEHDIIIAIDSLGKEDLLLHISRVLKIKIWVWPERLQIMHLLGLPDIFTTKTSLTRVRAVPRYSFSIDTLQGLNTMRPTIGIMPSGLPWVVTTCKGNGDFGSSPPVSHHKKGSVGKCINMRKPSGHSKTLEAYQQYISVVPYSDHSCFAEIQDFIKLVQPMNIKGIVSLSASFVDPLCYFGHLCGAYEHSCRIDRKIRCKGSAERVEATKTKSTIGSSNLIEAEKKRKRSAQADRVSRVSLLRRIRRGAKIVENDCPY